VHPLLGAAEHDGRAHAGFLAQFAAGGGLEVLAVIDAALRELPVVRRDGVAAAAVPDPAVAVEQDDADIGAIERKVRDGQDGYLRAITAEAGAS
jgi:hypothetical protein